MSVRGIEEIKAFVAKAVHAQVVKYKEETTARVVESLKEATPVDTGNARDGWRIEDGKIVNDVEYISSLNEGHSKQAPSHFIEQTVLNTTGVKPNGTIVQYL